VESALPQTQRSEGNEVREKPWVVMPELHAFIRSRQHQSVFANQKANPNEK
jgi:hypothetical protein